MRFPFFKISIFALVLMVSTIIVLADDDNMRTEQFVITGTVVDRISHKPVNAEVVFCEQIGEKLINFYFDDKSYTDKNGEFKLNLSKRPDKTLGNFALRLYSMRDTINKQTGDTIKVSWQIYITRYAAVDVPDSGNIYKMPVIEMDRVVYQDNEWPYKLPQKLIDMEREDSIKYSKYSIFE